MNHWLVAILVISSLAAIFGGYDLSKIFKISQALYEKFGEISKEHQEIKEEIQELSKKLAK